MILRLTSKEWLLNFLIVKILSYLQKRIENFNNSVDNIRNDVERLQQKVNMLYEKNT